MTAIIKTKEVTYTINDVVNVTFIDGKLVISDKHCEYYKYNQDVSITIM